jgi:hypothetical protein
MPHTTLTKWQCEFCGTVKETPVGSFPERWYSREVDLCPDCLESLGRLRNLGFTVKPPDRPKIQAA